jgi:hypothetical protein
MTGFSVTSRDNDPVQTVRTIARVAQMLVELRDEYVERPRVDTLQQIEQRLDDLLRLRSELHAHIADTDEDSLSE